MSNLSAFMHANVEQIENYKFAASPRFKGEDGKPMLWEICCISADEYARIRNSCVRQVPVPGKKGQYTQQLRFPGQGVRPLHGVPGPEQRRAPE